MNTAEDSEDCQDLFIESLQQFERAQGHDAAVRQFKRFAVDFLHSMLTALPPAAQPLFSIALAYRDELTNSAELDETRLHCWQAIDATDSRYDFQNKTNCALRAVLICLTSEPPRFDLSETSYWFLAFCAIIEDRSDLLPQLAATYFYDSCGSSD